MAWTISDEEPLRDALGLYCYSAKDHKGRPGRAYYEVGEWIVVEEFE